MKRRSLARAPERTRGDNARRQSAPGRGQRAASRRIKLGLLQMRCSQEPVANLENALRLSRQASEGGAQIICTPELFRSQYFCQTEDHKNFGLAESIPGPTTDAFQ